MQLGDMRNFEHHIFTQTTLSVGESVHGLGERFGAFNKVGQSVALWNADGGTSSDQAYKNVSFWLSNRGYGIFIDAPERVELEIGSERCCRVQTSVEGQRLKWYIIYGPSPKEVLYKYSILTGKPGKVPSWSFGLWLSTSFTTDYDERTVNNFLEGMKERDIAVESKSSISLKFLANFQLTKQRFTSTASGSRHSNGVISHSTLQCFQIPRARSQDSKSPDLPTKPAYGSTLTLPKAPLLLQWPQKRGIF
jgi:hypothetical protein